MTTLYSTIIHVFSVSSTTTCKTWHFILLISYSGYVNTYKRIYIHCLVKALPICPCPSLVRTSINNDDNLLSKTNWPNSKIIHSIVYCITLYKGTTKHRYWLSSTATTTTTTTITTTTCVFQHLLKGKLIWYRV